MSRRLLLGTGSGSGPIGPTDPVEPTPVAAYATTGDANILALRPTGNRNVMVDTVSQGGSIPTVLAQPRTVAQETPYGATGPDDSKIVFVQAGTYQGGFATGVWESFVGVTGNPADVMIFSDTIAADGVHHPYGPVYAEGVTLKAGASAAESPKYCAHIGGSARVTYVNTIFDASTAVPAKGNAGTVGMDGGIGTHLTFYGCEFRPPTGTAPGMNLHSGTAGPVVSKVSFINCIAPTGVGYSGTLSTNGEQDEMYVIGGTVTGNIYANSSVHVYTNLTNPVVGGATVTRDYTSWPVPPTNKSGLSAPWDTYFTPSALRTSGTTYARVPVTDAAAMSPVSGRLYVGPIPVTQAMWFNRFGFTTVAGAGASMKRGMGLDPPISPGQLVFNYDRGLGTLPNILGALPAGEWLQENLGANWILYPALDVGGNHIWAGIQIPTATGVQLLGSAQYATNYKCWYSDDGGTSFTRAPAGTPFPLPHAAQVM